MNKILIMDNSLKNHRKILVQCFDKAIKEFGEQSIQAMYWKGRVESIDDAITTLRVIFGVKVDDEHSPK